MNTIIGSITFALVLASTGGVACASSEADSATAVPAPFYNDADGPDALDPQAPQASSYYLRIPGSAFLPRASTTSFSYSGAGCISTGTASGIFATDLQIPQGATINYVRTYYYNQGVSGSINTFLTDYDGAGTYTEYTNFATTATSGYMSDLSPALTVTVNNLDHSYAMVINIGAADANLRFCGVRILYTL